MPYPERYKRLSAITIAVGKNEEVGEIAIKNHKTENKIILELTFLFLYIQKHIENIIKIRKNDAKIFGSNIVSGLKG